MKTQQELQDRITPEFIKWCCEYAEGFTFEGESEIFFNGLRCDKNIFILPLLLHRTIEGLNRDNEETGRYGIYIDREKIIFCDFKLEKTEEKQYKFKNYTGTTLTICECAILHCLLDVFEEVGEI